MIDIIETNWHWASGLSNRTSTKYIALHHAEASVCTVQQIDDWHKSNGWSGIGYHFFVRKNGSIYRGRPLQSLGAHVQGMNNCSIGICAEGSYMKETMPWAQKKAIAELLDYLKTNYYPDAKIVGHREIGSSNCPGTNYPLEELKKYKTILGKNGDELTMAQYDELKTMINSLDVKYSESSASIAKQLSEIISDVNGLKTKMIYNFIDNNMPQWAHEGVQFCLDKGIIHGTGEGLGLDDKDLKICTIIMNIMKNQ